MALYTIGEVALLCDINPVTLRAWQRRYGLLKPQRTDGGHRLFNDADIDRIREIKSWIDNGVQVSKVKALLTEHDSGCQNEWREHQETLLRFLQAGDLQRLRTWIKEQGRDYPAQTLIAHLFIPLRRRLQSQQPTLQTLLSMLDGVLINYISVCLSSARKKSGKDALVVGWNVHDTTRLWLEAWIATQQGWRVDVLAHSLPQLRPELFEGQTLLVWCGDIPTAAQQQLLSEWREHGYPVITLGP
ncbi:HTH-type transcriptional regulator MlrA [Enterobacter sp. 638]|uniref:HTH-type transcriptional regulator MlrA n=1 Tax=Enterobacter sp. (strain 638) TaxID=399742 RepID=A0A9J9GHX3_ENT38|nr:HTH-type transcriptional regulator MlrA [Enterobacter sp. 638]ABP61390.1 putative transcriptional regulator, MerR family [Enterobacter sp. 638]